MPKSRTRARLERAADRAFNAGGTVKGAGVVLALCMTTFQLVQGLMDSGQNVVNREQLRRAFDILREGDRDVLDTARREIALSCECCRRWNAQEGR